MNRRSILAAPAVWAAISPRRGRAADEFSGADKLRTLYSAQFQFTGDGLPVVPVAIADMVATATVSADGGLELLPEGEGGPELQADDSWEIRASATTPAVLRYWTIVWRGRPDEGAAANAEADTWKARKEKARVFEQGALFGVAGEVLDRREVIVGVAGQGTALAAEKNVDRLAKMAGVSRLRTTGVFTELVDRPHGSLEATGKRTGARVRNEGVMWFRNATGGPIRVDWQGIDGKRRGQGLYHGKVYVTIDRRGHLAVVNAVPEDRFLAGLVPVEIFPSAPDEALKAQAVAARGELLVKIGTRHIGDPFRLCSETHCQVYGGAGRETPRTTAAVNATRGQVLFTSDNKDLVDTVYSACCGGHSEHIENVWPDLSPHTSLRGHRDAMPNAADPYAAGVSAETVTRFIDTPPAAFCARIKPGGADRFRWIVTRTAADLAPLLAALGTGTVRAIEVLERGVSGRARTVKITGEKRTEIVQGELRIRQTFGGLRSSLFVVNVKDGAAIFRGAGFGHGVGMCQTGAIGQAEAGRSYRQILQHYYQGSILRKLW